MGGENVWCHTCNQLAWVWSRHGEGTKIKTTRISSEGLTCNSAKFCTSENFPLYGTCIYEDSCSLICKNFPLLYWKFEYGVGWMLISLPPALQLCLVLTSVVRWRPRTVPRGDPRSWDATPPAGSWTRWTEECPSLWQLATATLESYQCSGKQGENKVHINISHFFADRLGAARIRIVKF
jgi:hypothetical protein